MDINDTASPVAIKPLERVCCSNGPSLCRDCLGWFPDGPLDCPNCGSIRIVNHAELLELSIAHIDCDAFYAAVEKRDNPELRDKPLIVGSPGGEAWLRRHVICASIRTAIGYAHVQGSQNVSARGHYPP